MTEQSIFLCLEAAACTMLAAAAAFRARLAGSQPGGAVMLGLLCGLSFIVLRVGSLSSGTLDWMTSMHAPWLMAGAIAGSLFPMLSLISRHDEAVFFWLDSVSFGLTVCLQCVLLYYLGFGLASSLLLGLLLGLAPGILRDVAVGDMARMLDESWYAMAAALGGMLSLGLYILGNVYIIAYMPHYVCLWLLNSITCGIALTLILRYRRREKGLG